jgi:hypothetical protein
MRTCDSTRYLHDLMARAASLGLAGVAVLGCTGGDEPLQVRATTAPSVIVPQTPLDGATVPKYVDPVPLLGGSRVDGTRAVTVDMKEFQQKLLPASVYAHLPAPFNAGTFQWGYAVNGRAAQFPSPTIEARRGTATSVAYANRVLRRFSRSTSRRTSRSTGPIRPTSPRPTTACKQSRCPARASIPAWSRSRRWPTCTAPR